MIWTNSQVRPIAIIPPTSDDANPDACIISRACLLSPVTIVPYPIGTLRPSRSSLVSVLGKLAIDKSGGKRGSGKRSKEPHGLD